MSDDRCGATLVFLNPRSEYACVLDRGHEGAHQDMDGDLWTIRFPDESPKYDVVTTLNRMLVVLKDIRKAI